MLLAALVVFNLPLLFLLPLPLLLPLLLHEIFQITATGTVTWTSMMAGTEEGHGRVEEDGIPCESNHASARLGRFLAAGGLVRPHDGVTLAIPPACPLSASILFRRLDGVRVARGGVCVCVRFGVQKE